VAENERRNRKTIHALGSDFRRTALFDRNLAFTVFLGGLLASVAFSAAYSFALSKR